MTCQLVAFTINDTLYGFNILSIQEIIRVPKFTQIPVSLPFFKGIINLRGNIVPVIDLGMLINKVECDTKSKDTRIIVLSYLEGKCVGLLVDKAYDTIYLDDSNLKNKDNAATLTACEMIKDIYEIDDKIVVELELDFVLSKIKDSLVYNYDDVNIIEDDCYDGVAEGSGSGECISA